MKVGLYFGSFNPIHIGHLIIASAAVASGHIREVWFVVTPHNPLKNPKSLLHEQDRYDMVQLAIAEDYRFRVSDIEFRMPKPSYTIDTLTYLSEKHPEKEFHLIMGQDNLSSLHKWKNYERIVEKYGLLVYPRHGAGSSPFDNLPNLHLINAPLLDISATFIRQLVKNGTSLRYLVPEPVETFIKQKGFYF